MSGLRASKSLRNPTKQWLTSVHRDRFILMPSGRKLVGIISETCKGYIIGYGYLLDTQSGYSVLLQL